MASVLLTETPNVAAIRSEKGWTDVVIKPTIGASAHGAKRFKDSAAISVEGQAHATMLSAQGAVLMQPYQTAVESERERSLVYVDGIFCHAFSKPAFHAGLYDTGRSRHEATAAELTLAERVLTALPKRPVFRPYRYATVSTRASHHGGRTDGAAIGAWTRAIHRRPPSTIAAQDCRREPGSMNY